MFPRPARTSVLSAQARRDLALRDLPSIVLSLISCAKEATSLLEMVLVASQSMATNLRMKTSP